MVLNWSSIAPPLKCREICGSVLPLAFNGQRLEMLDVLH